MVQLKLFDMVDDVQYAMSLTSHELGRIKQVAPESYMFIKYIRDAVNKKMSMVRRANMEYEQEISRIYR